MSKDFDQVQWDRTTVSSPHLPEKIPVIAAKNIAYVANANRLQNLSIYLPETASTLKMIGTEANALPTPNGIPRCLVHIHGGAWRDSNLTSASIEATVAHAFHEGEKDFYLTSVVALNYTVSPTQHPNFHPYDPTKDNHSDPAREATHPMHIRDILHGFSLLRSFGLTDGSYILSGHSAGACLSLQATLQWPGHYGLSVLPDPPCPAAFLGFNGLYDLEQLVHGLGPLHKHLKEDYNTFLSVAFGADQTTWAAASPARFDVDDISTRVENALAPGLILLDQSPEDQLVPENQVERMLIQLQQVHGMRLLRGNRCSGKHSAPWEEGFMIWHSVVDVLKQLRDDRE